MIEIKSYLDQICELIDANGWDQYLIVQSIAGTEGVRIRLQNNHPSAPLEIINDYHFGINPLEQVQQECLRAIRSGHPGL